MELKNKKFFLPDGRGFTTSIGTKINGEMRYAKVKDFIDINRDSRVKTMPGFLYVSLLTRVVVSLGTEKMITTATIGKLTPEDFAFLVNLFNEMNHGIIKKKLIECDCGNSFYREIYLPGEA